MATMFIDGVPATITVADFKRAYLAAFPAFTATSRDSIIQDAIDAVYTIFDGVNTLFKTRDEDAWYNKTVRCFLCLVAWYIADLYPKLAIGIHSTGGMPMLSKKIGDVTIHYMDTTKLSTTDSVLESLRSNPYGNKALMMIRGAAVRFKINVLTIGGV